MRTLVARRPLPLVAPLRLVALLALAVLPLGACSIGWHHATCDVLGQSVSSRDGVLEVDGTPLPFDRWVDVPADGVTGALELVTATDAIRVAGVAGPGAVLRARLYSEIDGDGEAVIENGRLVARSQAGLTVFINAIEGTLPAGLALTARSGTGQIAVSAMAGEGRLEVDNGTGSVMLKECAVGPARIKTGTGDILLDELTSAEVGLESGTGAMRLERCTVARLKAKGGTGDIALVGCGLGSVEVASGTGDLLLDGGKADGVVFQSGTGDLTQRNGIAIGSYTER